MSKLSFEQNAILNAIKYHGKRTVREISNAVRTVVVITESEVKEFVDKMIVNKLLENHEGGVYKISALGEKEVTYDRNLLNQPTAALPLTSTSDSNQKKEKTMKKDLLDSLNALRTKLTTQPPKPVDQFDDKIALLDAIITLPEMENPLIEVLKDIKFDLQAIQKTATDAQLAAES